MGKKMGRGKKALLIGGVILAVIALLAVGGGTILLARLPEIAVRELEQTFPFAAELGSVTLSWSGKVTLEDITLRRNSDRSRVASVKRMVAQCSLRQILAARVGLESLLIEGVELSLREGDRDAFGAGLELPDYPIQVRGLAAEVRRADGADSKACLRLSDVAFTLKPQTTGCMAGEGSGNSTPMGGRVRVSGILGGDVLDSRLDICFPCVQLTPEVGRVLPRRAAAVWDELELSGTAALAAELSWPEAALDSIAELDLDLQVSVRDASVRPEWFPYRLHKIRGAFSVGLDELVITRPLVGWHDGGSVKVTGRVALSDGGGQGGSELVLEARGISVDEELQAAVAAAGEEAKKVWEDYNLEGGTLDASLTINGSFAPGGRREWAARVSVDGCSGSYRKFPYALTGLTGGVEVRPAKVFIRHLTGWHGDATVRVGGWVSTLPGRNELNVEIRGTRVRLDDDLASALGPRNRGAWDRFQPAGMADIDVVLSTPTRKDVNLDVRVDAALRNCSATVPIRNRRLALSDVTGRLEFFGDVCRISGLRARCLGGSATASGIAVETENFTKFKGELAADRLSADEVISLLPQSTARKLRLLGPAGEVSIRKLSIDVIRRRGQEPDIEYCCAGYLHDARVAIPVWPGGDDKDDAHPASLELAEINGRFDFRNQRGQAPSGAFELDKLRVGDGTIRDVVGRIKKTGPVFTLEDIRGEIYGGQVVALFKGASDLRFFTCWMHAAGVDVARLGRETGLTNKQVRGDLRATIQLSGERIASKGKRPTWRLNGSGSIDIDRANLGRTTLVRSLLSYKAFFLGEEAVVKSAKVNFDINSKKCLVDELVLSGPLVRTRGVGWVSHGRDMKVDLYFYRKAKGSLLPELPIIDVLGKGLNWIVDQIQNRIVVVHVTGTLRRPEISPAVLKDLGAPVIRSIAAGLWQEEKEPQSTSQAEPPTKD